MSIPKKVRVRFAPSPSGDLHVGNIRTALFNWAYARHTGGTFILRIEDTNAPAAKAHIASAIDALRWLSLNWDEGVECGGSDEPYIQSQRLDIYSYWLDRFLENKDAYYCFCTTDEIKSRNALIKNDEPSGYDGHCRNLTEAEMRNLRDKGMPSVIRMRMGDGETTFTDIIRGDVTFRHDFVPDFALTRSDGSPLYTLAASVDDVTMGITHILRGEDLLSSSPRQIRVYNAMGVAKEDYPVFAHLPFVMGEDNTKLAKRNGETSIAWYRAEGFLPETICNYLALLGWSPGNDREDITMDELADLFTIERVSVSPARFDIAKLEAMNAVKIRGLDPDDFFHRAWPFLIDSGLITGTDRELVIVRSALPIIQERITRLGQIPSLLAFLFIKDISIDDKLRAKIAERDAKDVLRHASDALSALVAWDHASIHEALNTALISRLGLKPRVAFKILYIAITGSEVSAPLFESMAILGKHVCLGRIARALTY
jgi:glutamyl-tRNA synthetase